MSKERMIDFCKEIGKEIGGMRMSKEKYGKCTITVCHITDIPWGEVKKRDQDNDWDGEYVSCTMGNKAMLLACEKIAVPDGFSIKLGELKNGNRVLRISDKADNHIVFYGRTFGKIVEKALKKCGENSSLETYSDKELDALLKKSSKALCKAVSKTLEKDNKDIFDAAVKEIRIEIKKKMKKYICKAIEKEQQKEGDDLE